MFNEIKDFWVLVNFRDVNLTQQFYFKKYNPFKKETHYKNQISQKPFFHLSIIRLFQK